MRKARIDWVKLLAASVFSMCFLRNKADTIDVSKKRFCRVKAADKNVCREQALFSTAYKTHTILRRKFDAESTVINRYATRKVFQSTESELCRSFR